MLASATRRLYPLSEMGVNSIVERPLALTVASATRLVQRGGVIGKVAWRLVEAEARRIEVAYFRPLLQSGSVRGAMWRLKLMRVPFNVELGVVGTLFWSFAPRSEVRTRLQATLAGEYESWSVVIADSAFADECKSQLDYLVYSHIQCLMAFLSLESSRLLDGHARKQLLRLLWRQSMLDFIIGSLLLGIEQPALIGKQEVFQALADRATHLVDAQIKHMGGVGLLS